MILREIITTHLLEILLITISAYVAIKTYGTRNSNRVTKAFSAFATANMIFQALDLCMALNREGVCFNGFAIGAFLYVMTLTVMAGTGYHWFIYVEEAIGAGTFASKKNIYLWSIPLIVFFVLCISSVKTGWIFTFDADGKYVIGSLFILQYVVIFGYCLLAMGRSAVNFFTTKERRDTDRTLLVIMLVDTVAVVIQLSFMVNMMNTALVLTVFLSYMTVYSSEIEQIRRSLEQERILKQNEEIERKALAENNANLFALEDDFESLYDVELETGHYVPFVKGDFYQTNVYDKLVSPSEFFEDLRTNVATVIYEDDRAGVHDFLNRDRISEGLTKNEHIDHYYRLITDNGPTWFKMRVVYKDSNKRNIIVGVFNAQEEMAVQEKEQRRRQELLSRMAGDDGVLLVDCVNDSKQVIHDYTHGDEDFYETASYSGTLNQYIDKYVSETDRDMMRKETSPEHILARVGDEPEYTVRYREMHSGEPRFFEMRVSAFSDTEVLQSFKNIDELVHNERAQKAISEDFFAIYIADLNSDIIRVVKRSPFFRSDSVLTENSYSKIIGTFISKLKEPDRIKWQGLDTADGVREFLAGQDKRELLYESANSEKTLSRATWFVLERIGGEVASICLAFSNLDEDETDREKLNERIAVQKEQLQESLAFTDYFLDTYVSAYYVNLETLSCQIYKRTDVLETNYPIISNYFDSVTEYIYKDVHPEDREDILAIVSPEKMKALLRERSEYSHIFRDISGGTEKYYRMQVIRGADEQHAAFGFIDITEEVRDQRNRQLEAEESRKLIDSIASSYNVAYAIDMKTDAFRLLRMDDSIIGADEKFGTFSEAKEFFLGLLPESDRSSMRHELDYDTIRETLKVSKSYDIEYRIPVNGAMIWHIMNVTAIDIANDYIAIGFARRDLEITQKHLEDKRYGEYFALYEIDIDSGMMKIVKDSPYYGLDRSGTAMPFAPAIMQFSAGLDDEPREFFEQFADLNYAKERFAKEDKLTYAYRSNNVNQKDWVDCTCYVTLRHEDGTPAMFTFGFSLIDSLGVYRQELQQKYMEQNEMLISQQEQLEEARNTAETANAAKTDFLFSMSHDIRTPMNAIMGFTNMAIKHIDEKERAIDCLEKTQKAGTMLLSLINSVLEVSRIESGNATLEEQPGNVYFSFSNIENTMREMAETKDIKLSFEFGDVKDKFVYVDFGRCMRVFVNVISNAIKYTAEGGFVKVRCEQLGRATDGVGTYQYTITDNGIGMSEEYQKHIFEQFSREQTSTVSGIQGSGLGMSVVKSFVDLMGGTVSVASKPGEGTRVTIVLPFRLQEGESYTDPVTGDIVASASKTEKPEEISFTGRKVLLVEDNELNREIAIEILEEEGVVVDDADDGTTAVQRMKEKGPDFYDFILMDIQMPIMNGYEATKAIREMYPDANIPIIALSANAFAEDKKKSLEAGMDDHVAKPINIKELFGILAKYLK